MKIVNLEQGSAEWLDFRKDKVGASDIGVLMTGSAKEICDLYWEKKGQEKYVTSAMRRGSDMESEARSWFERQHDVKFERPVGVHDSHEWLSSSFDGLNFDLGVSLEIKCPNEVPDFIEDLKNYKRYWWQVQAQLAVGGHEKAFLLAYSPSKHVVGMIFRDETAIVDLIAKGQWFHGLMQSNTPPPEPLVFRDDEDAIEFSEAARVLKAQMDDLEEQWKILRDGGIYLAGEISFECNGVKVQKIVPKPSIDYKAALDTLAPGADLSSFLKPIKPSWRLTVS